MRDIRDDLFRSIYGRRFRAALTAEHAGVLAGTEAAKAQADELGIELELCKADGEELMHGERIGTLVAAAKQAPKLCPAPGKRCRYRSRSLYAVLF